MLFFPQKLKSKRAGKRQFFISFIHLEKYIYFLLAFYALCYYGKAQNNELLLTAYVLQATLYHWLWKNTPCNIKQSKPKSPRSLHHSSAKLSIHSSIQSDETQWSPPSHRNKSLRGQFLQPLGEPVQALNYSHYLGYPDTPADSTAIIEISMGLKKPHSLSVLQPFFEAKTAVFFLLLYSSLGTKTELRSSLLPWFDFMQWRKEEK